MEQPPFTEFAAFLSTLRADRTLTQSDVARALEVAPSQVSGWQSGRSRPKPENLERMAEAFALDLDQLLALCKYRTRVASGEVDPDETEVLALYRQLADEHRPTVKSMLRGLTGMRARRHVTKQSGTFVRPKKDNIRVRPRKRRAYESQSVATMIERFGFQPSY